MNLFASILGDLVEEYWNAATSSKSECRLLVPGLTKNIAKDIHHYIKGKGVKSYLVIDSTETPNKANGYILPEGLTSEREGSFVVVTFPGQQAKIQDSIMGSGGVMRSAAFSDEYPWVDNGNDFFRFGKVVDRLLQRWESPADIWLKDCIEDGLVEATAPSRARGKLLLESLLGSFNPENYTSLTTTQQKLLCHCGIPANPTLPVEFSTFKKKVCKLSGKIKERVKDVGARAEIQNNAASIPGGQDLADSVDLFFDGMGRPSDTTGILLLNTAFYKNTSLWESLSLERLRKIFEIELDADLNCTFEVNRDRGEAEDATYATFHGEKVKVFAKYSTTTTVTKEILVKHGQKTLATIPCGEDSDTVEFTIDTGTIKKYSKKVPIAVQLFVGGIIAKEYRLYLHLCGEDRPAFLVIKDGFKVVDLLKGEEIDAQSDSPKITITSSTQVYGFGDNFKKISIDSKEVEHDSFGTGIVGLKQPVDASSYPRLVTAEFLEGTAGVFLETDGKPGGEFTLEDELRVSIIDNKPQKTKKILTHFEKPSGEQYLGLGLPEEASFRCKLAEAFEQPAGWEPILVDFAADNRESRIESTTTGIKKAGQLSTPGFHERPNSKHPDLPKLISKYADARKNLITAVAGGLKISHDRPVYAAMPIFVSETSSHVENLICSYIEAYANILSYLDQHRGKLEWAALFRICYLDSVVSWPTNPEKAKFSLLGPWHPLVVCKRFMVQKALYQGAHKLVDAKNGWAHNKLAVLLDRVEGSRWFFTLDSSSTALNHGYIAATSDPGWLFCFRAGAGQVMDNQVFSDLGHVLARNLGLEIEIDRFAGIGSIQHHMRAFSRAFPSKRAISLCIPKGYDEEQILEDARDLFCNPTEQIGNLLPGGARFYFEKGGLTNTPTFEWKNPPIIAYECDSIATTCTDSHVDIGFLPPTQKVSFSPLDLAGARAVRGEKDSSIFSVPLLSTSEGHDGTPNSKIIENEPGKEDISFGDVGAAYSSLLAGVSRLTTHPLVSVKSLGLPETLNSEWVIVSGAICDPAVFIKYICDDTVREDNEKALWEYKINIGKRMDSYYILSRIPSSLRASLWENGKSFVSEKENLPKIVRSLGEIGIAIGNEVMRSGKHALGILGQVAAIRLFLGADDLGTGILKKDDNNIGFLLQVDSFRELFGDFSETGTKSRADLLAVQISTPAGGTKIRISLCGIECKYVTGIFNQPDAAFEQATETHNQAKKLLLAAKEGIIERLALLRLIGFGLRMVSGKQNISPAKEALVLNAILRGEFDLDETGETAVVVSSESDLREPELKGAWVRLCPGHWPGIDNTDKLREIKERLAKKLFPDATRPMNDGKSISGSTRPKIEPAPVKKATKPTPVAIPTPPAPALAQATAGGGASINADAHMAGLKIPVGKAVGGQEQEFFFWPSNVELTQLNVGIIGDLGTGKTQLIKSLIYQLGAHPELNRGKRLKFLILDYKGDYTKPEFAQAIGAKILDPNHIPLNPFDVSTSKELNPRLSRGEFFIDMLKKIYRNIGPKQTANLRAAIQAAYQAAERRGSTVPTVKQIYEGYSRLVPNLDSASGILQLMVMADLFEEDLSKIASFNSLMDSGVVVVNLSALGQQDDLKNMLVTIFLNFYYDYMLGLEKQPFTDGDPSLRFIDSMLLVDEANSIMQYEFQVLKNILLQGREFGVGVLLASQYLSHFNTSNEKYTESLLTWFIHRVNDLRGSELERLGLDQSQAAGLAAQVKTLRKHHCLYRSYKVDGKVMHGHPFYKLIEEKESQPG